MNIEKQLQKDGIIIKEKIDTEIILNITNSISKKIASTFPNFKLNPSDIFSKLFAINMYKAEMPEGMQEASYCYKNSTIYFNSNISDEDLEEFAIHECIHYLQEKRDENYKLLKMGLADYSSSRAVGIGINEASVQYISAKIIGIVPDFEKYYNINIYTPSPSYYPVECALLNQLLFFINDDILFKSTYFSTNDFKNEIIKYSSSQDYKTIISAFDKILKYEEKIVLLNNQKNAYKSNEKIEKYRNLIKNIFFKTQNLIIQKFFDYEFRNISNLEQLENYRRKITQFDKYLGHTEDDTFFKDYLLDMMNKLEHKSNILENGGIETAPSISRNSFLNILTKIKSIFNINQHKSEKEIKP